MRILWNALCDALEFACCFLREWGMTGEWMSSGLFVFIYVKDAWGREPWWALSMDEDEPESLILAQSERWRHA